MKKRRFYFFLFAAQILMGCEGREIETITRNTALESEDKISLSPSGRRLASLQTKKLNLGPLSKLFEFSAADLKLQFQTRQMLSSKGCNSVAFWQINPGTNLFLGRELNSGSCKGGSWSLTLNQLSGDNFIRETRILDTTSGIPVPNSKFVIKSAYDPASITLNGETWVAFECHGEGFGPLAAICAGPLSRDGKTIIKKRLSVIVNSGSHKGGPFNFSASVPKLLLHKGKAYLYWTAIKALASGPWLEITNRGAEIVVKNSFLGIAGSKSTIMPDDPKSVEVWGVEQNDIRQNSVADIFQIVSDDDSIYAIAGVGGWDKSTFKNWSIRKPGDPNESKMCLTPSSPVPGCFRLAIARSKNPLELRGFNKGLPGRRVLDQSLPANPQEYTRIAFMPDGTAFLYGQFLTPLKDDLVKPTVERGLIKFPLNSTQ